MATTTSNLWVRLKPRNEKRGIKLRRYSAFGMRFDEKMGWYIVPATIDLSDGRRINVADYLSNVRNDNDDLDSPLAFDVMSEKEARSLDEKERKAAQLRATAVEARPIQPVDMTSADLRPPPEDTSIERTVGVENDEPHLAQPVRGRRPRAAKKTAA
jgi:hypothetical protein